MNTDISFMRQQGWFDPEQHPHAQATIVGVGDPMPPTALSLAKLGMPKLTLIDPDVVERHNLPNQMFPIGTTGQPKVWAVSEVVTAMTQVAQVTTEEMNLRDVSRFNGVVIGALDSMEARADLWARVRLQPSVPLYIDGRLGGESIVVYAVNPCDKAGIEYYEATLHSDEEAKENVCTRQSIIDVGFTVAALITRAVRRHYAAEPVERMVFFDQANLMIGKE
jgi:molybdopterin/thiamine biosynthesis adenylyltransferase